MSEYLSLKLVLLEQVQAQIVSSFIECRRQLRVTQNLSQDEILINFFIHSTKLICYSLYARHLAWLSI